MKRRGNHHIVIPFNIYTVSKRFFFQTRLNLHSLMLQARVIPETTLWLLRITDQQDPRGVLTHLITQNPHKIVIVRLSYLV